MHTPPPPNTQVKIKGSICGHCSERWSSFFFQKTSCVTENKHEEALPCTKHGTVSRPNQSTATLFYVNYREFRNKLEFLLLCLSNPLPPSLWQCWKGRHVHSLADRHTHTHAQGGRWAAQQHNTAQHSTIRHTSPVIRWAINLGNRSKIKASN